MKKNQNPYVSRMGMQQRKHHAYGKGPYYSAHANIQVSPAVKQGLCDIAEMEGRSLSWVVAEVFRLYFGLKDDTQYLGIPGTRRVTKLRRVK